jgi:hypothetical protein
LEAAMKVFLAGIMQGSNQGNDVHDQSYRQQVTAALRSRLPDAEIIDPWALHPDSPTYDDGRSRQTFLHFCDQAGQVDLLIAYVPQASMGTAVEMWEAYRHGIPVIAISPLETWAVRFLSWRVCRSLEELEVLLQAESLPQHRLEES